MGSLFRSEEMSLLQFVMPHEVAHEAIKQVGTAGKVHFIDLNPNVSAFQKRFFKEIPRVEEMEKKLKYIISQMRLHPNIEIAEFQNFDSLRAMKAELLGGQHFMTSGKLGMGLHMEDLADPLRSLEEELKALCVLEVDCKKSMLENEEFLKVIEAVKRILYGKAEEIPGEPPFEESGDSTQGHAARLFAEALPEIGQQLEEGQTPLHAGAGRVDLVAGVIERSQYATFERGIFRVSRGNVLMYRTTIDESLYDPETGRQIDKDIFIFFFLGRIIYEKILAVTRAFNGKVYPVPERDEGIVKLYEVRNNLRSRLQDNQAITNAIIERKRKLLEPLVTDIVPWLFLVRREKAIFHAMNMCNMDVGRNCLIAQGWCPKKAIGEVLESVDIATKRSGNLPAVVTAIVTNKEPPTYYETNKFTQGFQEIVDAYGIGRYQEVNPTPFTIVTFPFLFAVMFGDFGHGLLMTLFGLWLVVKERKLRTLKSSEIFDTFFGGRYIILMMGLFSIYTGLIYNDVFSKTFTIIPSGWTFNGDIATFLHPYAFGIDPAWRMASNQLIFMNSYKMKMAIILGVIQMSFGIVLATFNHSFFGNSVQNYLEFLPQILFMLCIFGYLCLMIVYKWCVNWREIGVGSAPNLLNTLIFMFLSPGKVAPQDQLYMGQSWIQLILILIAVACVPWLLIAKPVYLKLEHRNRYRYSQLQMEQRDNESGLVNGGDSSSSSSAHVHNNDGSSPGKFEFGEVMVHQIIHTIDFCLGAISNTASYLRLWALSLAHAQLSEVLWTMVIDSVINLGAIGIFIGFAGWFVLTLCILLIMEGLSAFLHALRLHWVEFNNKFYQGSGYKFEPFSFEALIEWNSVDLI